MHENGIRHVLINVEATKKTNIPDFTLLSILNIALDTSNYPLLIHCNHGKVRCFIILTFWQIIVFVMWQRFFIILAYRS